MDTATLVEDRATTGTSYDVLLRAKVATRFRARDRWLIAGSFNSEAAARQEYLALGREFPAETVSLLLVRCEAEDATGSFRERVLDKREPPQAAARHRVLRAVPSPREASRSRGAPTPRQAAPPPAALPGNAALQWQLAVGLVVATLLLSLLLR